MSDLLKNTLDWLKELLQTHKISLIGGGFRFPRFYGLLGGSAAVTLFLPDFFD